MRGHVREGRKGAVPRPARVPRRRGRRARGRPGACEVGDVFKPGDVVDVTGIEQGPRHRRRHQAPRLQRLSRHRTARTSTSATAARSATARIPGRVFKGKRMAGQYGQRARHDAEPRGRRGARRGAPALGARRGARARATASSIVPPAVEGEARADELRRTLTRAGRLADAERSRSARSTLPAAVFGGPRARAPALRGREDAARQPPRRHARDQDARRSSAAAARSRGSRRAPAAPAPAASARRSGRAARRSSARSRATTPTGCRRRRGARRCARRSRQKPREGSSLVVDRLELAGAEDQAHGRDAGGARHRRAACSSCSASATTRVERAARNLPHVKVLRADGLNVYDVLRTSTWS